MSIWYPQAGMSVLVFTNDFDCQFQHSVSTRNQPRFERQQVIYAADDMLYSSMLLA
jgi:hypothetical protein